MPEQPKGHEDVGKQLEESTKQKFAQYEAANAGGGGEESHKIWATFTEEEQRLWKELYGPLMPGTEKPKDETKE